MCQYPLFETLAVNNGKFKNIYFHQQRVEYSFTHYFHKKCHLDLNKISIPKMYQVGFFRCRVDYNSEDFQVNFYPYRPRSIRNFQLVKCSNLDYRFKYSDRKRFDFMNNFQTDEFIIVNNGFISDCTIGNLLFKQKEKWYSPMHYLLKGTQLSYLLAKKQIELCSISVDDIYNYEQIMMVNALNPFDPMRAICIDRTTILSELVVS